MLARLQHPKKEFRRTLFAFSDFSLRGIMIIKPSLLLNRNLDLSYKYPQEFTIRIYRADEFIKILRVPLLNDRSISIFPLNAI